ncbi:MAG: molybdopterin-dependent oxidoreductase [Myxococcales bacterium]|nr:molybdopterin-dependent oxidoreductase [Myxococcales bacterium]MBP6843980.1 molybdopterin-dependent oxidoreductase [Kofleriaceae bacterium]
MSNPRNHSRRTFLKGILGAGALGAAATTLSAAPLHFLRPMQIDNPLAAYPNRDWESTYRNIFAHDSSFVFLCAPNDTHNCLLRAYVKNDVAVRIGPTFGYGKAQDLYGNTASHRWDPRLCQKGLALVRRVYGDRRVKSPMIRRGFKEWADAGFPRDPDTGRPDPKYFQRGKDSWLRATWDEAYSYSAKALDAIARAYSGEAGAKRLTAQGYDPAMIEATEGSGMQTFKLRGGMAFLGATRIFGLYRFANMMALADAKIRGVEPDHAIGARGWDSYSWHTDLPPGHPMVTGAQTNDFDLFAVEHSKLCLVWGMNWITTKMPDSHWLTEARLKGTKVVAITVEYSATASKADEVIVIRPGTDPAFALGLAQVMMAKQLYDRGWVQKNTDLPFLIRMDTLQPLRPEDLAPGALPGYVARPPANLQVTPAGGKPVPAIQHRGQHAPAALAAELQSAVVWDGGKKQLAVVTRDHVGPAFDRAGLKPDLQGSHAVRLADGTEVECRPHFALLAEYLDANMTPADVERITGAPAAAIEALAAQIAANPERTLFATGMGPNQFFNADLKDRAILLVAALSRNLGFAGGNVGSYAGNYRAALFGGLPVFSVEDPFNLQLDPAGPVTVKKHLHYESLHYYNYGDRPLRQGNTLFTGKGHLPTPTKAMWLNNSNSVIGNVKWHYDVVNNTLPKIEFIAFSDWWWTASCEYSDIVFACDSWAEFKHIDMTASCTNPFVQIYPKTPLKRVFDTQADIEIIAGVSKALGALYDDPRFADSWKFVGEDKVEVYLQRILDGSFSLKGYKIEDLHAKAAQGIPALVNTRTYPRMSSYEQAKGEQPWHTKSGRLEFYRPEPEFIDAGENLIVHREPIDSTLYEPNAIAAKPHPALRPKQPEDYGLARSDLSCEPRQVRNVMLSVDELMKTSHPLMLQGYRHVYHTPKYRHGAHTTPVDTDFTGVLFGPFGDVYRHDKRMPSITEGYMDINPADAKALGLEDGSYCYVDADPEDRPYRGFAEGTEAYKVARLMLRVRYYPGTPRNIARTWHNMYGSTFGSVKGAATRPDGLARNPETNYQSMYRTGSHQSATRAWLKPTLMTESLVHKDMFGQTLMKGFLADVHCPVGAPREAFVKLTNAEEGAIGGKGLWRPAALGFRPTYESAAMKLYLQGGFVHLT